MIPPTTVWKVVELGQLCLQFGRVNRVTYHEDGRRLESDTDHTVMLGILACAFAEQYAPHLDLGLVAQFTLSDLPNKREREEFLVKLRQLCS